MFPVAFRSKMMTVFTLSALLFVCVAGECAPGVGSPLPTGNDAEAAQGKPGEQGPPGEDGSLRIFGDGSAGDVVITDDQDLEELAELAVNLQFNNLTIAPGVRLTIPSGMTVRVLGKFVNKGFIEVLPAAEGGFLSFGGGFGDVVAPVTGVSKSAAQAGELIAPIQASEAQGGRGGIGLSDLEARQILTAQFFGGAGGGAGGLFVEGEFNADFFDEDFEPFRATSFGSRGGGFVRILAQGGIVNEARAHIIANGESDIGGGGGGGVIILASTSSVENHGLITANGGNGQGEGENSAPSGGGGGGIVHILAPTHVDTGEILVDGGKGGEAGEGLVAFKNPNASGAGGGASGGNGGEGSLLPAVFEPDVLDPLTRGGGLEEIGPPDTILKLDDAEDGQPGHILLTPVDPMALL